MIWIEIIGWMAALSTLGAYSMRTMLPLRMVAILSNLLFLTYGTLTGVYPMLVLHAVLLPFNSYRLWEILRDRRVMKQARADGTDPLHKIGPLLKITRVEAGAYVFHKGDAVDHLYVLKSGQVLLEGIDVTLNAGDVFGEIAFFTDEKRRTLSARCMTPCEIAYVDEGTFLKLYYQDPSFGLHMMKLTTRRLVDGMKRRPEAYLEQPSPTSGTGSESPPETPATGP